MPCDVSSCHACRLQASGFGFSLVGVQGKDIVDGNRKLTLALIWQLRRYNLMQVLASVRTRSNSPLDDAAVMRWANEAVGAAGSGRTMSVLPLEMQTRAPLP